MHKGVKISSHLFTKLESVAAAIKFEIKIKQLNEISQEGFFINILDNKTEK